MNINDIYDRKGNPISSVEEWSRLFSDPAYKVVKHETVGDFWVSTVWLGMDHNFGEGEPLIFETMILDHRKRPDPDFDYQVRYPTEEDALIGHTVAVKYAKKLMKKNENK